MTKGREYYQQLLRRYVSNQCTPVEVDEVLDYLREEEPLRLVLAEMQQEYEQKVKAGLPSGDEWSGKVRKVLQENARQDNVRPLPKRRYWWAAAAILILLGAGLYFLTTNKVQPPVVVKNDVKPGSSKATLTLADGSVITLDSAGNQVLQQGGTTILQHGGQLQYDSQNASTLSFNTLTTPRGGQFRITLPDGTAVWLNAASSIRYPTAFNGNDRLVQITGEAYFEVAKDKAKPFRVKVNDTEVEVLGTHFNINAYADEDLQRTTLVEGKVQVRTRYGNVPLKPGQQLQVSDQHQPVVKDDVDMEEVLSWKNGKFSFNGNDIRSVMRKLEKWYDITVEYKGDVTKEEFVGMISRNVNISEILAMLEKTGAASFEIKGKTVIVK